MRYVRRRRRQRLAVILGSLAALAAIALAVLYVVRSPSEPAATPAATGEQEPVTVPTQEPVACGAELPKAAGSIKQQYPAPTDQHLDLESTWKIVLKTSCGDVEITLDVERAPKTSNSIVFLARKGFYDGTFFHRIAPQFVVQGGDPTGSGSGGSGYKVTEAPPDDLTYEEGVVAMAKAGTEAAGTSGSQFFIVSGPGGQSLTPDYALLGRVTKGMDVVAEIMKTATADGQPPSAYTYIERVQIVEK
jgi:peptidyl-prolyl cis-trans isomerase B (cyclophilin B)